MRIDTPSESDEWVCIKYVFNTVAKGSCSSTRLDSILSASASLGLLKGFCGKSHDISKCKHKHILAVTDKFWMAYKIEQTVHV